MNNWSELFKSANTPLVSESFEFSTLSEPTSTTPNGNIVKRDIGSDVTFSLVDFSRTVFEGIASKRLTVFKTKFLNCQVSKLLDKPYFSEIDFNDGEFSDCKISGVEFQNCNFREIGFKRCTFVGVNFLGCTFSQCVYTGGGLEDCVFTGCTFDNVFSFDRTKFRNIELRSCVKGSAYKGESIKFPSANEYFPFKWLTAENAFRGNNTAFEQYDKETDGFRPESGTKQSVDIEGEKLEKERRETEELKEENKSKRAAAATSFSADLKAYAKAALNGKPAGILSFRNTIQKQLDAAVAIHIWLLCAFYLCLFLLVAYASALYFQFVSTSGGKSLDDRIISVAKSELLPIALGLTPTLSVTPAGSASNSVSSTITSGVSQKQKQSVVVNLQPTAEASRPVYCVYNNGVSSPANSHSSCEKNQRNAVADFLSAVLRLIGEVDHSDKWLQGWVRFTVGVLLIFALAYSHRARISAQAKVDVLNQEVRRIDILIFTYHQAQIYDDMKLVTDSLNDIRKHFYGGQSSKDDSSGESSDADTASKESILKVLETVTRTVVNAYKK